MKTYFFDTNILVRYFLKDNKNQYSKISGVLQEIDDGKAVGMLSMLVIAETVWVFRSVYKMHRKEFVPGVLNLIAFKNIKIIECDKNLTIKVLKKYQKTNVDFTDVYLSEIATKNTIFSFDADFKKLFR